MTDTNANGFDAAARDALASIREPLLSNLLALDDATAQAIHQRATLRLHGLIRRDGIARGHERAHSIVESCYHDAVEAARG